MMIIINDTSKIRDDSNLESDASSCILTVFRDCGSCVVPAVPHQVGHNFTQELPALAIALGVLSHIFDPLYLSDFNIY